MSAIQDRFDLFVFDLDGTLADTREDIASSVNHALQELRRPPLDLGTVTRFVGDGARTLLARALGESAPEEEIEAALAAFLAHYRDACLNSSRLYEGVREALDGLRSKTLAVLTNKPRYHSLKILRGLGIEHHFRWIQCGDDAWPKKPDPGGLLHLARAAGCAPGRGLFVGDSSVDIATARAAHFPFAFVSYGFSPDAVAGQTVDLVLNDLRQVLDG